MKNEQLQQVPVAIIGIGCMFAKSSDRKSFLRLLMRGVDAITDPPETHGYLNDYFDKDPKRPDHIYCNRGGYLPLVDFDPSEFGIPPTALEATDTSQLLGLVVAKQALEDAGYGQKGREFDRSKTSVILGVTGTQELVIPLGARLGHPLWRRALTDAGVPEATAEEVIQRIGEGYVSWQESSFPGLLGNVVAGRIANRLDLGGTNCVVDAACASSMSAIHMAMMELTSGRTDMVLTGGVDTINDAFMHMCFSRTQILSRSGNIRPFSKNADGTVLGEGIGIIVLKRLADAQRDGDRIYAVIKALGAASDGKSQSIYAPRQSGQAAALRRAYQSAGVAPKSIELVEAHGTGTRVGDQVEFKALCDVFGGEASDKNRCALGSVKSNIGHTKAAAGTAGLIKAAYCLYHKVLLPTLKADPPDPNLDVDNSPFFINHRLHPWLTGDSRVRRAGVSAFGFGGSNFHAVLEEFAPRKSEPSWEGSVEIAAFSAESKADLASQVDQWCEKIQKSNDDQKVSRLAAHSRRDFDVHLPWRLVMVLAPPDDTVHVLAKCHTAREKLASSELSRPLDAGDGIFIGSGSPLGKVAFLFPGQGSQYVGMGRDLICHFPECLETFEQAERAVETELPLGACVFPKSNNDPAADEARLRNTDIAQPAIGAVSAAMLRVMTAFGVLPDATCGHSYGELVALHAAGRFDDEALWSLSESRGKLMAAAGCKAAGDDPGSMLAVRAPIDELDRMVADLPEGVVLANRNSPHQGVLSGPTPAIQTAEQICKAKGFQTVRLPVAAAFHSQLVANAQKPFEASVDQVAWASAGAITAMSNTLGGAYPDSVDQAKALLARQLATPVNFIANIENLYADGVRTFVEVGPKAVLTGLVEKILDGRPFHAMALDRSAGHKFGVHDLAQTLAQMAALGHPVRLQRWEKPLPEAAPKRMRIPLSGANLKSPRPVRPPVRPEMRTAPSLPSPTARPPVAALARHAPDMAVAHENNVKSNHHETSIAGSHVPHDRGSDRGTDFTTENKTMDPAKRDYLKHALTTVQQGLASMQSLQTQTTEAHQKYLEAQAEASRTLQQMLRSTQQLAAAAMGQEIPMDRPKTVGVALPEARPLHQAPLTSPSSAPPQPASIESPEVAPIISQSPSPPVPAETAAAQPVASPAQPQSSIQEALVAIVAQLTGYPEEMLGMEMDIESDLGIDSIKRVEILSALEDRMPELPKVTPDMMGTLKTLGQICEYLASDSLGALPPSRDNTPLTASPSEMIDTTPSGDDHGFVQQTLLQIVSELTGYPVEMLGLEMDIEADLGIDSIKRVEILSAMEDRMPDLPKVTPDLVGTLKTLGQICTYLAGPSGARKASPPTAKPESVASRADCQLHAAHEDRPPIVRQRIEVVDLPTGPERQAMRIMKPYAIGLVAGESPLGEALYRTMTSDGPPVVRLSEPSQLTAKTPLAGLVVVSPQAPEKAFRWAQACAPRLRKAAEAGCDAFFCTVSQLDGAFGFEGLLHADPEQGALAGLAKTAAIEWPTIRCMALDVSPEWPEPYSAAQAVWDEIARRGTGDEKEIGLKPQRRISLALSAQRPEPMQMLDLDHDDVVIVTGGARGVTAAAATELARITHCRLVLLGRSPQAEAEPEWLLGVTEESTIKKLILAHMPSAKGTSPKALEGAYRRWMANRQILTTMEQLRSVGSEVHYLSLDVRDANAVAAAITQIRSEFGTIKAIIHGAGILEDRLIVDKKIEQFKLVYDTKVEGLRSLLEATRTDGLRYLVVFSSVSARMGNTGQVDYAMANEALNKIALQEARRRPDCKVLSINWGPWDGGMVTPSLKRMFQNAGVSLIPVQEGARAMVVEMSQPHHGPVEVVLGGVLPPALEQPAPAVEESTLSGDPAAPMLLAAKRDIDLQDYPILRSHRLDGRPVVPFALITEWLAHGALHANPGLRLYGIDNLRLLKGIVLDGENKSIQLMAANAKRSEDGYAVHVEVRDGRLNGGSQIHSSATALLADSFPAPPAFQENGHFKGSPYHRSLREIYGRILFHGDALQGIEKIIHFSEKGLTAKVRSAPAPHQWLQNPLRSRWIADPLVMDCAFQMAIIWCYEHQQLVSLPSFAAAYRQYRDRFPAQGVTAVMEVVKATDRKLTADFTFLDDQKQVIASMTGYEAVMDRNLFRAFGVKAA